LGAAGRRLLRRERPHAIAAISCWEVAQLAARGRVLLHREPVVLLEQAIDELEIELLPLTPAVAVTAARLDWLHRDPADRPICSEPRGGGCCAGNARTPLRRSAAGRWRSSRREVACSSIASPWCCSNRPSTSWRSSCCR